MKNRKNRVWAGLLAAALFLCGCAGAGDNGPISAARRPDTPASESEASGAESDAPLDAEEAALRELLSSMTLEEKVGQIFLARCPDSGALESVRQYQLGGYVLFARDFENKTGGMVRETLVAYQAASKIPMLLAADEEGGTVVRISRYKAFRNEPFGSPQDVYAAGGMDGVRADTAEKAAMMLSLGLNVNMAPVCDVSTDPQDFIYARSFGQDAAETSEYVKNVVEVMQESGIGSVLKHFPGYGSNVDTHTGIAYDHRDKAVFETSDLLPFTAGIEAGADAVLVSHNVVYAYDSEKPASLSKAVHTLLRDELGFDGVIMTDDLYMDAIRDYTDASSAAVEAVLAGNDLLCCTDFTVQIPAVVAAVRDGTISTEQLESAVLRVLRWKTSLGILEIAGKD